MAGENLTPDHIRAQHALDDIDRLVASSTKRSVYPRSVAAGIALWAGTMAALAALESAWVVPFLFLGFAAWFAWIRMTGTIYREVTSRRNGAVVISLGLVLGALMIGGNVARQQFGIIEAPWISGAITAIALYTTMELTHRSTWAEIAEGTE